MADNRKTYRLDDDVQAILTDLKEDRGGTENEAINLIIKQYPLQGKKIVELHNENLTLQEKLHELQLQLQRKEKEEAEFKNAFALVGKSLLGKFFDSSLAADQAGAAPGQAKF